MKIYISPKDDIQEATVSTWHAFVDTIANAPTAAAKVQLIAYHSILEALINSDDEKDAPKTMG